MNASISTLSKEDIVAEAKRLGAALVGFAPVSRWAEHGDLSWEFDPRRLWPLTKTVIAMAVPSLLPITETDDAFVYRSQYNNTNQLLDKIAYRLAAFLNRSGHPAINICRDGYGDGVMRIRPIAVFSHVWAGHYAGIGEVGWNHCLVTAEFGPRHRLVSVLTSLELEGDPMIKEGSLCNKCLMCQKACLTQAFSGDRKRDRRSNMNKFACFDRRARFKNAQHCGFCLKVCPTGEDRKVYGTPKVVQYLEERRRIFAENGVPLDPVASTEP
jgi:epoxyqueuosine reductase QueG